MKRRLLSFLLFPPAVFSRCNPSSRVFSLAQVVCFSKKASGRERSRLTAEVVSAGPRPPQPRDGNGLPDIDQSFGPEYAFNTKHAYFCCNKSNLWDFISFYFFRKMKFQHISCSSSTRILSYSSPLRDICTNRSV